MWTHPLPLSSQQADEWLTQWSMINSEIVLSVCHLVYRWLCSNILFCSTATEATICPVWTRWRQVHNTLVYYVCIQKRLVLKLKVMDDFQNMRSHAKWNWIVCLSEYLWRSWGGSWPKEPQEGAVSKNSKAFSRQAEMPSPIIVGFSRFPFASGQLILLINSVQIGLLTGSPHVYFIWPYLTQQLPIFIWSLRCPGKRKRPIYETNYD